MVENMVLKIMSNLVVEIRDIGILYEDKSLDLSLGITIKETTLRTTNQNWEDTFAKKIEQFVYKSGKIVDLSLYIVNVPTWIEYDSDSDFAQKMAEYFISDVPPDSYVIPYSQASLKLCINLNEDDFENPKLKFYLDFENFNMILDSKQFTKLLRTKEYYDLYLRAVNNDSLLFHPRFDISPQSDPSSWWTYLIKHFERKETERVSKWSWENIKTFKNNQTHYINYYRKLLKGENVSKQKDRLIPLEKQHSFEDLLYWRKLAKLLQSNKPEVFQFFGSKKKDTDWRTIFSQLDLLEGDIGLPPDYRQFKLKFHISNLNLDLVDQHGDSFVLTEINNIFTSLSLYPAGRLICSLKMDKISARKNDLLLLSNEYHEDNLSLLIEVLPSSEKKSDLFVGLKAKKLLVYFSTDILRDFVSFFGTDVNPLDELVSLPLDMLKEQTMALVQSSLEERYWVELDFEIESPTIFFPGISSTMIVDLGFFQLKSTEPATNKEVTLQSDDYFYDMYNVHMEDIQIYFVDSQQERDTLVDKFKIDLCWKLRRNIPTEEIPLIKLEGKIEEIIVENSNLKMSLVMNLITDLELDTLGISPPTDISLVEEVNLFSRSENSIIEMNFHLGRMNMNIHSDDKKMIAQISISDVSTDVHIFPSLARIDSRLKNLLIDSPYEPNLASSYFEDDDSALVTLQLESSLNSDTDKLSINFHKLVVSAKHQTLGYILEYLLNLEENLNISLSPPNQHLKTNRKFKIVGNVNSLQVNLCNELIHFFFIDIGNFYSELLVDGKHISLKGSLHTMSAVDSGENKIIDIKGEKLLSFDMDITEEANIWLSVSEIEILVLSRSTELLNYIFPLVGHIKGAIDLLPEQKIPKDQSLILRISVSHPTLRIPSLDSHHILKVDLGNTNVVHISEEDRTDVQIKDININTIMESNNMKLEDSLLKNSSVSLSIIKNNIIAQSDLIDWSLDTRHVNLAICIFSDNIYSILRAIKSSSIEMGNVSNTTEIINIEILIDKINVTLSNNSRVINLVTEKNYSNITIPDPNTIIMNTSIKRVNLDDISEHAGTVRSIILMVKEENFLDLKLEKKDNKNTINCLVAGVYIVPIPEVILECTDYICTFIQKIELISEELRYLFHQNQSDKEILNLVLNANSCSILLLDAFNDTETTAFEIKFKNLSVNIDSDEDTNVKLEFHNLEGFRETVESVTLKPTMHVEIIAPFSILVEILETMNDTKIDTRITNSLSLLLTFYDFTELARIVRDWTLFIDDLLSVSQLLEPPVVQKKTLSIDTIINEIELSVIDDFSSDLIKPVLKIGLTGQLFYEENLDTELNSKLENIRIQYFNFDGYSWEPILEPSSVLLYYKIDGIQEDECFEINADDIELNISPSILKGIIDTFSYIEPAIEILSKQLSISLVPNSDRPEYLSMIHNDTGYEILLHQESQDILVCHEESVPLRFTRLSSSRIDDVPLEVRFTLSIENRFYLQKVDFGPTGVTISEHFSISRNLIHVVKDVKFVNGSKVLLVRSNYTVNNETSEIFDIRIKNQSVDQIFSLFPKSSFHLPLSVLTENDFLFSIRKKKEDGECDEEWTEWTMHDSESITISSQSKCFIELSSKSFSKHQDINITIYPFLKISNRMPVDLEICFKDQKDRETYETIDSNNYQDITLCEIKNFCILIESFGWSKEISFDETKKDIIIDLEDDINSKAKIHLSITKNGENQIHYIFYSRYYLLNDLGLKMTYKHPKVQTLYGGQYYNRDLIITEDIKLNPLLWYEKFQNNPHYYYGKYSPPNLFLYGNLNLQISVEDCPFSQRIKLDIGSRGILEVVDDRTNMIYLVNYSVTAGYSKNWRTNIVKFRPAYVLVNNLLEDISYKQKNQKNSFLLPHGKQVPFHWTNADNPKTLLLTLSNNCYHWSTGFNITIIDSFKFILKNKNEQEYLTFFMDIKQEEDVTFIVLSPDTNRGDYILNNDCQIPFMFNQVGYNERTFVKPDESKKFFWENGQDTKSIALTYKNRNESVVYLTDINPDEMGTMKPVRVGQQFWVRIRKSLVGLDKVITLEPSTKDLPATDEEEEKVIRKVNLICGRIGISLITEVKKRQLELMYIYTGGINLELKETTKETTIDFRIKKFQIDNSIYLTPHSVALFSPTEENPFVLLKIVLNKHEHTYIHIKTLFLEAQNVDVTIDQVFLSYIIHSATIVKEIVESTLTKEVYENRNSLEIWDSQIVKKFLYIEEFDISSLIIFLSFATASHHQHDLDRSAIDYVLNIVSFLANVNNSPILLPAMEFRYYYSSEKDIIERLFTHYKNIFLMQTVNLLFNADFLGNPLSLIGSLGTGVRFFIDDPGSGKGTRTAVYGITNSIDGICKSVLNLTSSLSSEDKRKKSEIRKQKKAEGIVSGLRLGLSETWVNIKDSMSGLLIEPIQGAEDEGFKGAMKGVIRGSAGIIATPLGIVNLLQRVVEGAKNSALEYNRERIRKPRHFGSDNLIMVYESEKAEGQEMMSIISQGEFMDNRYIYHTKSSEFLILISDKYIFKIRPSNTYGWKIVWKANLSRIEVSSFNHNFLIREYDINWNCSEYEIMIHTKESETNIRKLFPSDEKRLTYIKITPHITGPGKSDWQAPLYLV
eukprot:TRINITY_DN5005_c0_g1_i1.p1 TRINITY_DN5005_c0_g1~~TRINITY_DN5005_c0_g1_i1.p1  ORF type:complete len:2753 (-),score=489.51 TRINITY_DN5005_c0_g1_i1:1651-9480(-)